MIEKKACGDMHNGGSTSFSSGCSNCLKASNLPSYEDLLDKLFKPVPDQNADRSGMWELNYTDDEQPICVAGGAAWLYGRGHRPVDKPLAIIYSDEILIPDGIMVQMLPDAGAVRLRLRDALEADGAEAMKLAEKDASSELGTIKVIVCPHCGNYLGFETPGVVDAICTYCGKVSIFGPKPESRQYDPTKICRCGHRMGDHSADKGWACDIYVAKDGWCPCDHFKSA